MIRYNLKSSLLCVLLSGFLLSCDSEQSLQEYYVDSKANDNFVMLNVPANLLSGEVDQLSRDQKEVLKTVQKINILALPQGISAGDLYPAEKSKIQGILAQDGYEELMSIGKPSQRMRFYLKGDTEAIDEVVVFVLDDQKGFMLARVLGEDMNIAKMVRLVENIKQKDSSKTIQLEGILDIFKQE